ncbi:MAG: PEGA domain-containing protein [Myxococcales bacterium]
MTEYLTGVVEHKGDDELDLQAHFLELAEHFARYRRMAWWTGLCGLAARVIAVSLIVASLPADLTPGTQPQASPVVTGIAGLLVLASAVGFVACVSLYALSRARSWVWGLLVVPCSFLLALLVLLIMEDYGYGQARKQLEQYGTVGIPSSRPSGAAIGGILLVTLVFAGIGAARIGKVFSANYARLQTQAKQGLPAGTGPVAKVPPAATPGEAEPLPDYAKRPCLVGSYPGGAAIFLDGQPTGKTTPGEITIWAGKDHTVRVVLEGYAPAEKGVFAGLQDRPEVSFDLVAYPKVEVASEPDGAEVYVDGKVQLAATPGTFYAEGAETTLTVRKRGFADVVRNVALQKDKPASVSVKLVPAFYLTVESKPEGALVILDGSKTAQRTPAEIAVVAGAKHDVQIEFEGVTTPKMRIKPLKAGASTKVSIDINAAQKAELKARLKKATEDRARLSSKLRRLEAREMGFADSPAVERKRQAEMEALQKKVDELQIEIETLRDDLAGLQQQ